MDLVKTPINIGLRDDGLLAASSFRVFIICRRATILRLFDKQRIE